MEELDVSANDEQRERLTEVVQRLTADDLSREVMPGWTIGAMLGHLAFWDRLVIERWTRAIADGDTVPMSLSDVLTDLINGASLAQWLAMPGPLAGREAVAAADAVDAYVEGLEEARVAAAEEAGLARLIDRSRHRVEHLDAIEAALGDSRSSR
jgi:L-aminopeptidase/D-esterase-like protein